MAELIEYFDHPPLSQPKLIMALEGWIDAGSTAVGTMSAILDGTDTELVATFNTEELLDHRARRPIMTLIEGHMSELTWPSIELHAGTDTSGNHVLMLVGAEPDRGWARFCSTVVDLALDLDVQMVIGLGAYPAPVPHTRKTNLALTSPSAELLASYHGFVSGSLEVPAGIQAALEMSAYEAGIDALGLWAQVPHYITGMSYPPGSLALIEGLERTAGLTFTTSELAVEAAESRTRLDALVEGNEQHESMLRKLEEVVDSEAPPQDIRHIPSGDELADEFQAFLRDQNGEPGAAE